MKILGELARSLTLMLVTMFALYGLWVFLEIAFTGAPDPSRADSIIWYIASLSLAHNANHWLRRREGGGQG